MIRTELLDRGIYKPVSTIITQVKVDPFDKAFSNPSKVIGRYMSEEDALAEEKKGNYVVKEAQGNAGAIRFFDGVHLFLHEEVGGGAYTAFKEVGVLKNGNVYALETVTMRQMSGRFRYPIPIAPIIRQDILHSFYTLYRRHKNLQKVDVGIILETEGGGRGTAVWLLSLPYYCAKIPLR
jgi:hypothetical protein